MAKTRVSENLPDDIELLNIHRYPDTVPPSRLAQIRNSKVCQKRLEELLKTIPGKRAARKKPVHFQQEIEAGRNAIKDATAGTNDTTQIQEPTGFLYKLKKIFS